MKSMFIFIIAALVGSFVFKEYVSYPTGAPKAVCDTMMPGHPFEPQKTKPPPYKITFNYNRTNENYEKEFTVSIFSDKLTIFKGFFIQARTEVKNRDAVGTWTTHLKNTKYVDCFDKNQSAVTHHYKDFFVDRPGFKNVTLTWTAPENLEKVFFVATVVETRKIFWTFIKAMLNLREHTQ